MQSFTKTLGQVARVAAVLVLVGAGQRVAAQDTGGPTPGNPPTPPTAVPLDGGAGLLLAGGVAYGLRRLRQRRK